MTRSFITAALAGAAILTAGPALAQGRGHGHGAGAGVGAGASTSHGNGHGVIVRTDARVNSQGPSHASDRALVRANENSVLYGTARVRALRDLDTGMVVRDTNGATIGTVSRVLRSGDGTVRNVLVRSADGQRIVPLAPSTLSLSGGVVTTTRLAASHRRR
jgi:hypothetical protein